MTRTGIDDWLRGIRGLAPHAQTLYIMSVLACVSVIALSLVLEMRFTTVHLYEGSGF
jgi:hypothetical protein